jgi:HSP20 family protein
MPIKWRQFRELEKRPFELPDIGEESEWVPFMPAFRPEEPAVDIYQDRNNLYVEVSLVGVKPENVEVSIEDNILTIQGKAEEKKEIKEKDYLRKEIRRGTFRRVIKLPVEVKGDKALAESAGGMLKITIPKVAKAIPKTKRVPIKIR